MARSDGSQGSFLTETPLGTVGLLWRETGADRRSSGFCPRPSPERLSSGSSATSPIRKLRDSPEVAELGRRIDRFLHGEPVAFDLGILALADCPGFQREVLLAESRIPRGWVSTYERIAQSVGAPRAARAVGTALAQNPFPLVVPCHRAIRADGDLGGFQGGRAMKRALLELEGIRFAASGKGDAREGLVLTIAGRFFVCDGPPSLQEASCETSPHRRTVRSALARERHRVHPAGPRVPVHGRWPARL